MPGPNQPGTVASRGPIVPQKFFLPPQPEPPGNVISEEDGDWWVSVFQCGAVVTLAAALSVAATTSAASQVAVQQQDDKGNLSATVDEYFWQNPTPPVAGSLIYPQQFSFDPNDISAAGNTPAVYSSGSPPTVIIQGSQRVSYVGEDIAVPQHPTVQPEEDFWTPQIPPSQWNYLQPITDDVVIVPQPTGFQPDEDLWQNPAPPPVTFLWPQQFSFDQNDVSAAGNTPAVYSSGAPPTVILQGASRVVLSFPDEVVPQQVAFQPDEDFWQNPVPPVPLAFAPFQPWVDEQTPFLHGQYDEDFWTPQIPPQLWLVPVQAFSNDEIITQQVSTQVVDEFFFAPLLTCAYPNFLLQQWQFETGDNGGLTPPPVITPKINILRWASTGSRMTPPYNP